MSRKLDTGAWQGGGGGGCHSSVMETLHVGVSHPLLQAPRRDAPGEMEIKSCLGGVCARNLTRDLQASGLVSHLSPNTDIPGLSIGTLGFVCHQSLHLDGLCLALSVKVGCVWNGGFSPACIPLFSNNSCLPSFQAVTPPQLV